MEQPVNEKISSRLAVDEGDPVLYVRRLRLADERPIFVCDSFLPTLRFPALEDADYRTVSLTRLLEERTGRKVEHARQWIGAATAESDVADLLEIPAGVPVLTVRRITCVTGNEPVEAVEAFFHPERYQHYNELSVQPAEVTG